MDEMETAKNLPEAILMEIKARLPLKSIARFKSTSKTWKSTIESVYFRRLFVSLHKNSSSSWSLIREGFRGNELMGIHGCETWDIPKSPASYIPSFPLTCTFANSDSSSNGLVLMEGTGYGSFVGNPLLQQWVKIPSCHQHSAFGLMTRVDDEDGVVLSFKVVKLESASSTYFTLCIYSSETGIWTSKRLHCPYHISYGLSRMSLNGTLYLLSQIDFQLVVPGVLLAHDFYSESDHFRVIPLPDHSTQNYLDFKRALSTSQGFVTYIKTLGQEVLKIWRLNNDECWQLLWGIRLPFIPSDIGYYAPMAMHPFDSDIVYMWSQQNRYLISCNLRTQNYRILKDLSERSDHQDCFMKQSICGEYMEQRWGSRSVWDYGAAVTLFQFVLPRWMESVPCPPQVEMINTSSLLSYVASIHKSKKGNEGF